MAGLALSVALMVLARSGYRLHYAGDEGIRTYASVSHWLVGLAMPVIFTWHYVSGLRMRRRVRTKPSAPTAVDGEVMGPLIQTPFL